MMWWIFKRLAVFVLLTVMAMPILRAQQDSSNIEVADKNKYKKRVEKYYHTWDKLIPRYGKLQYAGSMGFMSLGIGWDYGKNKQWETDFMIGYIPKFVKERNKLTFTLKQNFMPWKHYFGKEHKQFLLEPLACGLYINTLLGHNYWSKEPERNPNGYYTFATKLRVNVYLGQRITFRVDPKSKLFARSVTFFYEISSNDLYIMQAVKNSYLKPKDYLYLSFGVKIQYL